ncbi:MAG: SurA N-terminal domain-containing protein, partial [Bacteroidetes bacterium]|nr:SurA N-terminal domain-containing protein [Bacteroidota bacterium]
MSVIQTIRDKAAWLVFGLIALSLTGFLLMDAFVGKSRLFGGNSTVVGSVDGQKLDYVKFQQQVSEREEGYKSQGYPMNDMMQQNIKDQVWKEFIENSVMDGIYDKLGIDVGDKELNDMLVGPNAIPDIKRSFTDPKTGIFDAQAAASAINQLRTIYKSKKTTDKGYDQAKRFFEESIPQIIKSRQKDKYMALIGNSTYIPKWMAEKMNADNNEIASINFVDVPYSTIADSTIKISDDQISDYISNHKEQYKQEESRSIAYVAFNAAPTSADSAKVLQQLLSVKAEFDSTKDVAAFIARNGSETGYLDEYLAKSRIQVPKKDSIFPLKKGELYGPYLDGNNYVLAKKVDEKELPDSVHARHILVAVIDPKTGQPIMDDSTAKKKIDSIKTLIDKGERFDSLAAKLSDDEGSKLKGGDLGYFPAGQMVKEFNDFCFDGKKGDKKIVRTQFGYHYIEILDQKNFEPAYKIAYLSKAIEPSTTTTDSASGLANLFAGQSRDAKSFDDNVKKQNLQRLFANDIAPTESNIQGLGPDRQFVRWIYDDKTGVGDVSEPYNIGDKYIVATVTEINKKGTMSVAKARPLIEPILRNKQKAEQISKKIGTVSSLDAVASATGQQVLKSDSILFASPYIPNAGKEDKVIGASFDKQLQGKPASQPIAGNGGVFVIKV